MNKCSGVVGVFNCQGAGWCRITKKTRIHDESPGTLTTSVRAADVDAISNVAGADWKGDTIVYAYRSGTGIIACNVIKIHDGFYCINLWKIKQKEMGLIFRGFDSIAKRRLGSSYPQSFGI